MTKDKYAFLPAALEVHETPPHPAARAIVWAIVLFFGIAVAWAAIGEVDIVAVAQGKIIPSGHVKTIQPLEIGVIQAIHVRDGQAVRAGDLLIELDPTTTGADEARLENELLLARLNHARLRAMADALRDPELKANLHDHLPDHMPAERIALQQQILDTQLAEHRAQLAALDRETEKHRAELRSTRLDVERLEQVVPIVERRTDALKDLQAKKLAPESEYLELEQERIEKRHELAIARSRVHEIEADIHEAEAHRAAVGAEFRRTTLTELQAAARELSATGKEYLKARERSQRQMLTAPVAGVVQQLAVHTVGGVVTPAQALMEIVPEDSALEVEAWLPNKDVGFVDEGQRAEVKVETFPFTKYGTIDGEVLDVSNDAVSHETLGLVYAMRVRMDRSVMPVEGKLVNLTPGMAVTVEVKTGKRRLIEFFLSPLLRYQQESIKER
jgi:hemolysin D